MRLPQVLRSAIDDLLAEQDARELARASSGLSERYRGSLGGAAAMRTKADRAAYVGVRMPATFAAVSAALEQVRQLAPSTQIRSVLDLGAGPGTASWAACEAFPSIESFTCVERDAELVSIARGLFERSGTPALRTAKFEVAGLDRELPAGEFDLVVISYALGELETRLAQKVLSQAWQRTRNWLLIIEPGTRPGFATVLTARQALLGEGAHLLAPCPHHRECPMHAAGDWCHFSARLERTGEHRRMKQASLGYEDEKFSYVVATRGDEPPAQARVVRHPMRYSGYTQLMLCEQNGLERTTVTRSQKELYRKAKKTEWGDAW